MVLGEGRHFKSHMHPSPLAVKLFKQWSQKFEFLKNLLLGERKGSQRRTSSPEERYHIVLTACHINLQESLELRNGQVVIGVGPHPGQDCRACQHFAPI